MVTLDRWTETTVVDGHNEYVGRFATVQGALEQLVCVAAASLLVAEARIELVTDYGRLPVAVFGAPVAVPGYELEQPILALTGEVVAYIVVRDPRARAASEFDRDVLAGLADGAQRKLMVAWSQEGPRSLV